jgi:cytochrome b
LPHTDSPSQSRSPPRTRVWDALIRVTHWTFVASVAGAWLTRGAEHADAHAAFGYGGGFALIVRIAWGFIGPRHARFSAFAYAPRAALRYVHDAMRGTAPHYTGHNPAGSWAVWLLLALIAAITLTGIAASAGMHSMGPLAGHVPAATAQAAFSLHELLAWIILAVAALHLAGVAWGSRVHRENLAAAMITGRKVNHDEAPAEAPARGLVALGFAVVALGAAGTYLLLHVPKATAARIEADKAQRAALAAQPWTKECGSCHLAYPMALLPARSWTRMLEEQDRHFGEDLGLSREAIARLLAASPGDSTSWASSALSGSVPAGESPQRLTELPLWRHMHERVPPERFKPPNAAGAHECDACHRDAASGIFHPRMIQSTKPGNAS